MNINFLKEKHSSFYKKVIVEETKKWGKVICRWDEVKDGKTLHHVYAATINLKTGDIYLDCRRRKIWAKSISLSIGQPVKIFLKTAYHVSMIPIGREIFKYVKSEKGERTKKELLNKCVKSLADIVRTPAYGVALIVLSLSAAIIIPFRPNFAYDFREVYGKVEASLHRGQISGLSGVLALCFQPNMNIDRKKSRFSFRKRRENTDYSKSDELKKKSVKILNDRLTNFARSSIQWRRNNRNPFNDCFRKLDENKSYQSTNLSRCKPKL